MKVAISSAVLPHPTFIETTENNLELNVKTEKVTMPKFTILLVFWSLTVWKYG